MTRDVIKQAAFARGRVLHGGTGEPVAGDIEIVAREGPVVTKFLPSGEFVLSGHLGFLFPDLAATAYKLNLTMTVTSEQFSAGRLTRALVLNVPAGASFDPDPPTAARPLIQIPTVNLPADPITIRGRVVKAEDPTAAIAGATVTLTHAGAAIPPAATGADGRYSFDGVTLVAPVVIQAAKAGFVTISRGIRPEYGLLVNEENFRLSPP
jgi:Carboxypeptidase regulatory-like domain